METAISRAYPKSKLNITDWPSIDSISSKQGQAKRRNICRGEITRVKHKTKLEYFHPFGCPVFVLDAALQGGVPQWDP